MSAGVLGRPEPIEAITAERVRENPSAWGLRYWFAAGHPDEEDVEMSAATLVYVVRHSEHFAFSDGTTIDEASSHDAAEIWSDVIWPAIERGDIEVTYWGRDVPLKKEQ